MNDTRSAAERLRDKMIRLAKAYLDEHPADDGEAVTEEWLRAVGFDKQGLLWFGGARLYIGAKWDGGTHSAEIQVGGGSGYYGCDHTIDLPKPQTRGEVRRLCQCLGIEIKEAT
jgi:hypothetical protein